MQGDVQSAIKHLRRVSELHQLSHKWNDPRILRALADLGDMDAFLLLLLLGMNDIQTFSEFTNANGITTNRLVKEKLLDTSEAYTIECMNDISDMNKLTSHIQSGIILALRVRTAMTRKRMRFPFLLKWSVLEIIVKLTPVKKFS